MLTTRAKRKCLLDSRESEGGGSRLSTGSPTPPPPVLVSAEFGSTEAAGLGQDSQDGRDGQDGRDTSCLSSPPPSGASQPGPTPDSPRGGAPPPFSPSPPPSSSLSPLSLSPPSTPNPYPSLLPLPIPPPQVSPADRARVLAEFIPAPDCDSIFRRSLPECQQAVV